MLKKVYQSPLFNAALILGLGVIMLGNHYSEDVPNWMNIDPLVLGIPILVLLLAIPINNLKNPKDKVKPTLIPMEFKEEDEGLQWITYKATRKVYIFFASSLPFAIALTAYFNHIPYFPIILLTGMGIIQYILFWFEHKKHK
ncbi:hypothetical protein [Ureibacillus chungkukjangi]|uniref:Uncharacterized protein n=1 Tax=Ureibacillus chungkukjangi TaxID=1202712 RepID=A0A318TD73_9BACL|nr:hypothetical protein [Ureibacillus chungkukjangi]PYF01767.1 hypothetical protein BJ095_1572 [Ureibacillus chungkukjangi]